MGERQAQNHFSGNFFTILDVLSTKVTQSGIAQSGGAYLTDNGDPTSGLFTAQLDPDAFENGDRDLRGNHFACQHRSRPTDRLISDDFILAGESVDLLRREAELPIDVINHLDHDRNVNQHVHTGNGHKGRPGAHQSLAINMTFSSPNRRLDSIFIGGDRWKNIAHKANLIVTLYTYASI